MATPSWAPPRSTTISTELLAEDYADAMQTMRDELAAAAVVTIGVDGATDIHSRTMNNVLAFGPRPWFIEYLRPDPAKSQTAEWLASSIANAISRLNNFIGKRVVTAFVSDSCNTMRATRQLLVENETVDFAYGCASHALHNMCESIAKTETIKESIRCSVFVVTSIKNNKVLRHIYETLSTELLGRKYTVLLYSSSRWGSICNMLSRLIQTEDVIAAMNAVLTNNSGFDESANIPLEFVRLSSDPGFWERVHHAESIFSPICSAILALESNSATLVTAYACFLTVRLHIELAFDANDRATLTEKLLNQWGRIWTPVHALAFYCDPCFRDLRLAVFARLGHEALGLGQGDICEQCRTAIAIVCLRDGAASEILDGFLQYCLDESRLLSTSWSNMAEAHPRKVWAQATYQYPALAPQLLKVYCAPVSTAAVERNHKVMKRINCKGRCAMGDAKAEMQIAVAFNSSVGAVEAVTRRQDYERRCVSRLAANDNTSVAEEANVAGTSDSQSTDEIGDASDPLLDDFTEMETLEQAAVCASLQTIDQSSEIPDSILFAMDSIDYGDR